MSSPDSEDGFAKLIVTGAVSTIFGGIALYHMGYGDNPQPSTPPMNSSVNSAPATSSPPTMNTPLLPTSNTPLLPTSTSVPTQPREALPATTEVYEKEFSWIVIKARGAAVPWAKQFEAKIQAKWDPWNLKALAPSHVDSYAPSELVFSTSPDAAVIYSSVLGSYHDDTLIATSNFAEFFSGLSPHMENLFPVQEIEKAMPGVRLIARGDAITKCADPLETFGEESGTIGP